MAPPILKLDDIKLTFGVTPLLDGANLQVEPGDRICLVGRNGSGKSTLMKIAAGLVEAQSGEVFRHPAATIRYLEQAPDFAGYDTVQAYAEAGLGPGDDPYRVTYLLEHLGLTGQEHPASLSGGEARRAALARVMAPEPDILMLDEPTNHLDLPTIEWLESELQQTRSALVLISHDRRFLEKVSTSTVWLDRGQSRRLNRGFAHFEEWRDKVLEEEELEQHKLGKAIEREEHWMRYGVTARRKRNMRRVGELQAMRAEYRGHKGPQGTVQATVTEGRESGKLVIEAEAITKAYGERVIVAPFSLRVHRGDCIGFVGPNGAGKTTLLKMLTGQLEPDSGTVKLGTNLEIATLDQKREDLNLNDTLAHYLTDGRGENLLVNGELKHVTGYMKDFLFQPEQARTPIRNLSGGERARLILARILARPTNLLILDEPTNDLDIETLDLLQEIVAGFSGTVILVSHDRDFLDRTVTSTIAPVNPDEPDGRWIEYAGGYSDMMAQRKGAAEEKRKAEKQEKAKAAPSASASQDPSKAKGKLSFKQKFALENLPKEMEKAQGEIAKREQRMADPELFTKDPAAFNTLAQEMSKLRDKLEAMEEEWLELEMLREELEG
ncbi:MULTISPECIES: ABC-F family ATP-binding cassette domain-containing protein [Rhizobium/Agrobacterium group]|uniref:ABC-F family ATP-binding cassette domain-containing protein n=1 Tax=Rhizobium/Agrobacterium group TaxID=227290 RepID=UPI000FDA081F|nr:MULTISPECIES: ABC-F family ATP-binding cassette domain-containing protein [Rhizobium/Agrobacterium group]MBB4403351.1 ATP-binding cassette subfamily F protein uup [Agrobacterium radiobacter]MBB5589508.1 ATP-binding cassette subfamily F protein uup [Agrobacterium radiobacter]NTB95332.1 ABC-F family ATP-binding cassette domain-containing protein [Agrobacterium tumefaciens]NTC45197.1 ABC-F family ATP-binding cassette domain-containing protein [Agrobacterium tumefaciens]RVT77987.1 ABC transport